jgi:CRP-like cAMP-binding protein
MRYTSTIPLELLFDDSLPRSVVRLYGWLESTAVLGKASFTNPQVAEKLGLTTHHAQLVINRLVESGWVFVYRRGHGPRPWEVAMLGKPEKGNWRT